MSLPRIVSAETLDGLTEEDPAAMRSRRDLRRVHRFMATRTILRRKLRQLFPPGQRATPLRVLELGAGDGTLMLGVARALGPAWHRVELTLLDRQDLIAGDTLARYSAMGWSAVSQVADVLDWAAGADEAGSRGAGAPAWDLVVANIFLHHFAGSQLAAVLGAVARRTDRFFACEPRRAWHTLAGSYLIGAIGVNFVTRGDAVLSVHAGFRDSELAAAWPGQGGPWQLQEYSAGVFSHCFSACRVDAP
jgi:hypothetical protein